MYIDSRDLVKARVLDFLEKYGDKGFIVLKTAIEISLSNTNNRRFGDFSYQSLVFRLNSMGIGYNPSNILRILEREYGVIEKTYSSSRQKWYRFIDLDAVREALYEYSYGTTGSLYYSGANCDTSSSCTKWYGLPGTGCYKICSYTNLYRATEDDCLMRTALVWHFCPVCKKPCKEKYSGTVFKGTTGQEGLQALPADDHAARAGGRRGGAADPAGGRRLRRPGARAVD